GATASGPALRAVVGHGAAHKQHRAIRSVADATARPGPPAPAVTPIAPESVGAARAPVAALTGGDRICVKRAIRRGHRAAAVVNGATTSRAAGCAGGPTVCACC